MELVDKAQMLSAKRGALIAGQGLRRSSRNGDRTFKAAFQEANGLQHPLGNDSKGFIDVIIHDLSADDLRDLAPTIPFEMVQEVLFLGNAEELATQFEAYAKAGLEYMVMANITGVVGGMDEIMARGADLPHLMATLREL